MYSDWSAELAPDAPVLSIPWHDATGRLCYIDLLAQPQRILEVPEALEHPPLAQALLTLNHARSPVTTAKCDVWPLDEDDLAGCAALFDLAGGPREPHYGFGSYIDIALRDVTDFSSAELHMELVPRLARMAAAFDFDEIDATNESSTGDESSAEFVLRLCARTAGPDTTEGEARIGYAITAYVYGVAPTAAEAYQNWQTALAAIVQLLCEQC